MAGVIDPNDIFTQFTVAFNGVPPEILQQFTVKEINCTESLLTPGLQTSIIVDNYRQHLPLNDKGEVINRGKIPKSLEPLKGKTATFEIEKPILKNYKDNDDNVMKEKLKFTQRIYRLSDRKMRDYRTEELVLHCCDDSMLADADALVNKSWVCATPSSIVEDVLNNCVGVGSLSAESSAPARNYIAENIHPFQVVTQQAEAALAAGDDPSFVHFMTYEDCEDKPLGRHHFKSLHEMANKNKGKFTFYDSETGDLQARLAIPHAILWHENPADFDLLLDILNGVGEGGNSLITINPFIRSVSLLGNKAMGCGVGAQNLKESMTNMGAPNLNGCASNAEKYLMKRQARMSLLEVENISMRLSVPWNGNLHVGQLIDVELVNKLDPTKRNYGTGRYLISALTHNVKRGGMATTTLDCVSNTVSRGEL